MIRVSIIDDHSRFVNGVQPRNSSSPTILYCYFNPKPRDQIQELTFAGISRYAETRGWRALAWSKASPDSLATFLRAHSPVAGCIVECSDDNATLPPRLFGRIPVVYLHATPSLYGTRIRHMDVDNVSVARVAFRELSVGLPAAYAAVGDVRDFSWSRTRIRAFRALTAEAKSKCRVFTHDDKDGKRAARLAEWVASLPLRTAVFAVNDFTATEIVAAARTIGRLIPRELMLCSVDNVGAVCDASSPTLTSIQLDFEREGYLAAKMTEVRSPRSVAVPPLMAVWRESTQGSRKGAAYILAAVERIRREACNGLAARDIIASSPGSKSLFNLRFREAMGHSVMDEILHIRLERVFDLLRRPNMPISAIADFSGFALHQLDKVFRARFGCSLRDWRKRNVQP